METPTAPVEVHFPAEGGSVWAGMGDFRLISPDLSHEVLLMYAGEPPHGDSYHRLTIEGKSFPGHAWGCLFAFTADSRYFAFSWMERLYDRKTVVTDLQLKQFFVLPKYIYEFTLEWPSVLGSEKFDEGRTYTFTGAEIWSHF
jgi:hypothetical protein